MSNIGHGEVENRDPSNLWYFFMMLTAGNVGSYVRIHCAENHCVDGVARQYTVECKASTTGDLPYYWDGNQDDRCSQAVACASEYNFMLVIIFIFL